MHTASDFSMNDPPMWPLDIHTTCHYICSIALLKNASAVALIECAQPCQCGYGITGPLLERMKMNHNA
jgi:hypothetical protein